MLNQPGCPFLEIHFVEIFEKPDQAAYLYIKDHINHLQTSRPSIEEEEIIVLRRLQFL